MADATAMHSHGCLLYYGSYNATNPSAAAPAGTAAAFTEVGEVISMNGVAATRNPVNVSHLNSDNRSSEFIPGRMDAGEITAQLNLSKVRYALLRNLASDTVNANNDHNRYKFLIWIPHGTGMYLVCRGFIASLPVGVPDDDRVTVDLTIKLSGQPTAVTLP